MSKAYAVSVSDTDFEVNPDENLFRSMIKQYEYVIVQSLITSFGLDFIIQDHHGGDVDTVHNVRRIGKDENMTYKSQRNADNYANHGEYDSYEYHSHDEYKRINRQVSETKKSGQLIDTYTGEKIAKNGKSDLDHVISAKEIHEDRGRVLSGLNGADLANCEENLKPTNPHTNRTKKADSMDKFIDKYGNEYTESQKENMQNIDKTARQSYERKISQAYYTSPEFRKDLALSAGNVAVKMGLRQTFGLIFSEIWFSVKSEFLENKQSGDFDLGVFFKSIGDGVKVGFENAKSKYRELFAKFIEGSIAGAISSITTTLCNIFFTTAKNVVKIIRQSWASITEAVKILFLNPDNLLFGDRVKAAVKVISVGASVVVGTLVSEMIEKTPVGAIPIIGDIVQVFFGTLVSGIMSCTLLCFLDRSKIVNKLVSKLNSINTISSEINYLKAQAVYLEKYAAELMQIDIEQFRKEVNVYNDAAKRLTQISDDYEMNAVLKNITSAMGIKLPWQGDFDTFMGNRSNRLVFE